MLLKERERRRIKFAVEISGDIFALANVVLWSHALFTPTVRLDARYPFSHELLPHHFAGPKKTILDCAKG